MINLIKADLYKLRKSKSLKILFILSIIASISMSIISYNLTQGNVKGDMVGLGSFFADFQMVALVSTVLSATFICNDFDNKTINDSISNGYSRSTIIISKTISYFFAILLLLIPYIVTAGVCFVSGKSFDAFLPSVFLNIMKNESNLTFNFIIFLKFIAIWITMGILYTSQLSICILLAFLIRKPSAVIGIGYGINVSIAQLVTVDKLKNLFEYTPFGVDYSSLNLKCSSSVYFDFIIPSITFLIIIIMFSYLLFRKSEVK